MPNFTVYTDKQNEYRWKFVGSNDAVLAKSSESFKVKDDCIKSLNMVQKDVVGATVQHAPAAASTPVSGVKVGAPAQATASSPTVAPKN